MAVNGIGLRSRLVSTVLESSQQLRAAVGFRQRLLGLLVSGWRNRKFQMLKTMLFNSFWRSQQLSNQPLQTTGHQSVGGRNALGMGNAQRLLQPPRTYVGKARTDRFAMHVGGIAGRRANF